MVTGSTRIDFSRLNRAERFIDARDLSDIKQLIDRGKLKIGEDIWEGWTLNELEDLLINILDTITEYQIDSLYNNPDTYLSYDIDNL